MHSLGLPVFCSRGANCRSSREGYMAAAVADPNHQSIVTPDQPGRAPRSTAVVPWEAALRRLNRFVRTVAFVERAGNGLGTLVFTWATVVILGGFSTNLQGPDFWYATTIVFLEAFRVFSRQIRSDDELLFKTTGSIRLKSVNLIQDIPHYLNVVIVLLCSYVILVYLLIGYGYVAFRQLKYEFLLLVTILALVSMVRLPQIVNYIKDNTFLQFSPIFAVLALGGVMLWYRVHLHMGLRLRFVAVVIAPLLLGCLQYSVIGPCLRRTIPAGLPAWLCKLGSLIFLVWIFISLLFSFGIMGAFLLLGALLIDNIQIPLALARIMLSSMRLSSMDNHHYTSNKQLVPTLKVFYGMVLAQGSLYILTCLFESSFSRHLRRSLARSCELVCKKGIQSVDLYYEYAYDKCMDDGVLSQVDLSLFRYAADSLDSNSLDTKLAAVQILHSLLQQEDCNKEIISKIAASTKAVTTLISMLGWESLEDEGIYIRLFASKIIVKLAGDLRILGIPGTMQMVSSLFYAENIRVVQDMSSQTSVSNQHNTHGQQPNHDSDAVVGIEGEEAGDQPLTIQASTTQVAGNNVRSTLICKFLQHIKNFLSAPKGGNEPWRDYDFFPVLGILILERLAHNLDNCAEISRAIGLIPKIIGFLSYSTDITNISEAQQKICITSSLKLVAKLSSTKGEIGITLRQKISEQPILLSNFVEVVEDSRSDADQWHLIICILANLAVDKETSQEIGSFQVLISKLNHSFFGRDEYEPSLRIMAGKALSNLSMESASNCLAILSETGYKLTENLKNMLQNDEYTYTAASLLQNFCAHCREKMCHPRSSEHLSSSLPVVLVKIMDAEGKILEALVGLAALISNVVPECFAHELELHTNGEGLVQKLVGTLKSNKPNPEYPRLRRVIVEMAISIVEKCPHYVAFLREKGMMEALSKVENTTSKVEKYRVFVGNVGVVLESGVPLRDLVVRAKGLIGSPALAPGAHPRYPT